MRDIVAAAAALARIAHTGQTRMDDVEPYINHPRRVAETIARCGGSDERVAIAWLHDVVEDTAVTLHDLRTFGFSEWVVAVVDVLTKREGELHSDYLDRVAEIPGAVMVKRADMQDNLASLPEGHGLAKRYTEGLKFLGGRHG